MPGCKHENSTEPEAAETTVDTAPAATSTADSAPAAETPAESNSPNESSETNAANSRPNPPNLLEEAAKSIKPEEIRGMIEKNIGKLDEMVAAATSKEKEKEVLDQLKQVLQGLGMMKAAAPYVAEDKRPALTQILQDYRPQVDEAAEKAMATEGINNFIVKRIKKVQEELDQLVAIWAPEDEEESGQDESAGQGDDEASEATADGESEVPAVEETP